MRQAELEQMGTKGETNHKETGELLNHLKKIAVWRRGRRTAQL